MGKDSLPAVILGQHNFGRWKRLITSVLMSKGVFDVVDGTRTLPADAAARAEWYQDDARAQVILISSLDEEHERFVRGCTAGRDIWTTILRLKESTSQPSIHLAWQELHAVSWDGRGSIAGYLARITEAVERLKSLGKSVDAECVMGKILVSLPAEFAAFRQTWNLTKLGASGVTLLDLQTALLAVEADMKASSPGKADEDSGEALAAAGRKKGKGKKKHLDKTHMECFSCGKKGHFKSECPAQDSSAGGMGNKRKPGGLAMVAGIRTDTWYGDSGAFTHMTGREEWFTKLLPADENVTIADGTTVKGTGRGNILIRTFDGRNWEENTLTDVLYIPEFGYSLFSFSACGKRGFDIHMDGTSVRVKRNGRTHLIGHERNGMFEMVIQLAGSKALVSEKPSLDLWHLRLAHISEGTIKSMMEQGIVEGMDGNTAGSLSFCEGCQYGGMSQKPAKTKEGRDCLPGEVMHMDIMGPLPESLGRRQYVLCFKDEASSMTRIFFLREKSEALDSVKTVIREVSNDFTAGRMKVLRSDNAKEFTSKELKTLLLAEGVKQEFSPPHTPQSNGFIERDNRTLMTRARSMLRGAQLPDFLWAEALQTAAYISNRVPCCRQKDTTPYEMWHGFKPDLRHLRAFGCDAFYYNFCRQKKMEAKAKKGSLVGYQPAVEGHYRIYDAASRSVVVTRNVRFNEVTACSKDSLIHFIDSSDTEEDEPVLPAEAREGCDDDNKSTSEEESAETPASPPPSAEAKKGPGRPPGSKNKPKQPAEKTDRILRSKPTGLKKPAGRAFLVQSLPDPETVEEALQAEDATQWKEAIQEELQSLADNNTWTLETLPAGRLAIKNKWVLKKKMKKTGDVDRYKARIVAKGFCQQKGIDYTETFSPVTRYQSIRAFLAVTAGRGLALKQFDVKTAFLNGDLEEELYMDQPAGFGDGTDRVCRLQKAIYGLKQAPRCWNKKFNDFLCRQKLKPTKDDPCMYYRESEDTGIVMLALYVDDGLLACELPAELNSLLAEMNKEFNITVSDPDVFVGLEITRCQQNEISISQRGHIDRILTRFGMSDCKAVKTPGTPNSKEEEENLLPAENFPYREAVGSLMFAMVCTRPDIAYEVSRVSKHLELPAETHVKAVKRILRYLKGTRDQRITYAGRNLTLESFSDSGFATSKTDPRSQAGRIHMLNGGPICWRSQTMDLIAHSTTEAEYMALDEAVKDIVCLRSLLSDIGCRQKVPTTLWNDNQGAIAMVQSGEFRQRTRHIAVRFHYVREQQQLHQVEVKYLRTDELPADMLTKSLSAPKLKNCLQKLGMFSDTNESEVSE